VLADDKLLYVDVAHRGVEQLSAGLRGRGLDVDRALLDKRLEFVNLEDMVTGSVEGGTVDRALLDDQRRSGALCPAWECNGPPAGRRTRGRHRRLRGGVDRYLPTC
jgi:hypothetical protein